MNSIKKIKTSVSNQIKDNTIEISTRVKEIIMEKSIYYRRFIKAFPYAFADKLKERKEKKLKLIGGSTSRPTWGLNWWREKKKKERREKKIKSKDRVKSLEKDLFGSKKTKKHLSKNHNSGSFRNNYKNYQYDYEEDFYEPY